MPSFTPQAAAGAVQRLLLLLGLATLAGVLVAGLLLPLVGSLGLATRSSAQSFKDLPAELSVRPLAQRSVVFDANGKVLATFYDQYRIYRPLKDIPKVMRKAIIAIEDYRFYEHGPIDLQGTSRALVRNLQSGSVVQGGSTLTQQYVKLLLIDQAETKAQVAEATATTPARKLRELRLAIAAEQRFTKNQILERYLNIAYFGGGAYGVEAAARHYFDKTASDLTLKEAALLAGLVQSPSAFDPARNPQAAKVRRNLVLTRMDATGAITTAQAARARRSPLGLHLTSKPNGCVTAYAPFFCDYVERELLSMKALGATRKARERLLMRGGLFVRTTLDPRAQASLQKAIWSYVDPGDSVAAAAVLVEPGTGRIKAMAQSRRYGNGPGRTFVNYATNYDRGGSSGFQPGSTFKAFVLAAAIDEGIPTSTKINAPDKIDVSGRDFKPCSGTAIAEKGYAPESSTGSGVLDLYSGTAYSNNTFYIQLEERTGLCRPAEIAAKLGVTTATGNPLLQVPSFTLGVNEVSPLAMANAYATFAAHGVHCTPLAVTQIRSLSGKNFSVPKSRCEQVIDQNVADTVTDVLRKVIDGPLPGRTGAKMSLGRPAAGKTGTTESKRAVWFVGFVPQLAGAVAVADPRGDSSGPIYNRTIGGIYRGKNDICGGCLPGPIWKAAMESALKDVPEESFTKPEKSSSADQGTVPDVRGLSVNDAGAALASAGYRWRVAGQVGSSLAPGLVVGTGNGQEAGASLPLGEEIRLYTSTGSG